MPRPGNAEGRTGEISPRVIQSHLSPLQRDSVRLILATLGSPTTQRQRQIPAGHYQAPPDFWGSRVAPPPDDQAYLHPSPNRACHPKVVADGHVDHALPTMVGRLTGYPGRPRPRPARARDRQTRRNRGHRSDRQCRLPRGRQICTVPDTPGTSECRMNSPSNSPTAVTAAPLPRSPSGPKDATSG